MSFLLLIDGHCTYVPGSYHVVKKKLAPTPLHTETAQFKDKYLVYGVYDILIAFTSFPLSFFNTEIVKYTKCYECHFEVIINVLCLSIFHRHGLCY